MTEAERESHLEPDADQDQEPGAITASGVSDPPGAPPPPGEAERSSPDIRRGTGEVWGTQTAATGVPSAATQGGLGPGRGGDPPGGPQPRGQEGQPAAGEEGATESPPWAQEFGRGRERANQPLAGKHQARRGATTPKKGRVGAESNRNAPRASGGDPRNSPLREIRERGTIDVYDLSVLTLIQ